MASLVNMLSNVADAFKDKVQTVAATIKEKKDNKDTNQNNTETPEETQTTSVSLQISADNICDDGRDDSEVLIEAIQNAKLDLIKELYEIVGEDFGNNKAKVETRNYMINNPITIGGGMMAGDINIDLSNYKGGIISVDGLMQIVKGAKRDYAAAAIAAIDQYGASAGFTDKGKLMALAQFAAESGFVWTAEIGKGKGRKYGVPTGPYNKIYYGRGPIQITWDYNYKNITEKIFPKMGINANIYANPELCETNLVIGCAASLAWFMLGKNGQIAVQCANNGDVDGMSKAINGGWNGIEKRRKYTKEIFEYVNSH